MQGMLGQHGVPIVQQLTGRKHADSGRDTLVVTGVLCKDAGMEHESVREGMSRGSNWMGLFCKGAGKIYVDAGLSCGSTASRSCRYVVVNNVYSRYELFLCEDTGVEWNERCLPCRCDTGDGANEGSNCGEHVTCMFLRQWGRHFPDVCLALCIAGSSGKVDTAVVVAEWLT